MSYLFRGKQPSNRLCAMTVASLAKELVEFKQVFEKRMNEMLQAINNPITELVQRSKSEFDALKAEIESFRSSMTFMNKTVEEIKSTQADINAQCKSLADSNKELTHRVAELEQCSRINNLEIKGVPSTQGEDCIQIMQKVGGKVRCAVGPEDFEVVHRVPARSDEKNLIARFRSREKRNEFLAEARKTRLTTKGIGFSAEPEKAAFVNEHLTPSNKRLFGAALKRKEKKWMFLWTNNCVIRARQTTDSTVFRITSEKDLEVFSEALLTATVE